MQWWTLAGHENEEFHVLRSTDADGEYKRVTSGAISSISADGAFAWNDVTAQVGVLYWYKLEAASNGQQFGPVSAYRYGSRFFLPIALGF